jgi:hypothetical protein
MIFCLIGVAAIFLPWARVPSYEGIGLRVTLADRNGLASWHGIAAGITFVVLFLFLVATSPVYPVPLWRSIILSVLSTLIVIFSAVFVGDFSRTEIKPGAYVALALGFVLLFITALEFRGLLMRRSARWESAALQRPSYSQPLEPQVLPQGSEFRPASEGIVQEITKPPVSSERGSHSPEARG